MSSAQVIADSSTRVIAIANQKGGVGKTTTTVSLGAALADEGQRVLLIDLDPQANASTGLGINPRSIEKNMYDVLLGDTPLEDTLEPAADVEGLFVAPSSLDLAGAEIELVPGFNRERRLLDALAPIVDDYDFVFIDCPPSLGLLTINALVAATEVLVPIQCEYYALEGVGQLVRNVELVRKSLNPALAISTIVLVMFDARTKLSGQVVDEVRAHFGDIVCDVVIPRVVRLSEAPSYGQPITVFDPENRGAVAYRDLAKEVLGEELDLEQPWDAEIQAAAAEAAASEGDAADEAETDGDVDVAESSETVEVSEAEESSATGESSHTGTDVPSPPTERADDAVQTTSTEDAPAQPVEAVQATEAPEASDPVPSNPVVQSDEFSQSIDSTPSNPMTQSDSSNDFGPEGSTVQSVQNTANTHQFEGDR